MPPPLDPDKRAAIAQAIRDGGKRNEIAREHDVSPSTVTTIARHEGIADAFDRTATKRATEAKNADVAASRAQLKALLLSDAFAIRLRIYEDQAQVVVTGDGVEIVRLPATAGDVRNFMTAVGIAVDKIVALEKLDLGGGVEEAAGLIRDLVDSIRGG